MSERGRFLVGTRGSALALCQAEMVEEGLRKGFSDLEVERKVIVTTGDRRTDVSLKDLARVDGIWDKGVFVKELEVALLGEEVDVAVHSLKDLPSELGEGLELGAVLPRAAVEDVLVTKGGVTWGSLGEGKVVGTSSVRRAKQLEHLRPGVKVVDLRGNVPTRLAKLPHSEMDGIILAEAGLARLGYATRGVIEVEGVALEVRPLDRQEFLPAAAQGAIGLEIRKGDERARHLLEKLNHFETSVAVAAEREFLRCLGAGCHTPVGIWVEIAGDEMKLVGRVFEEDGRVREGEFLGKTSEPLEAGRGLVAALS